ncbi:adenosine deaminase [Kineococcus terrestris]|uniref:adenosine deaminase n=1 Tax=Kineococcus terrestris TaxID=2044856 RepID=UPI0034DACA65
MHHRPVETLPKAHLHLHFTGSMRPATLRELAAEHGVRLPPALDGRRVLSLSPDVRGWFRFQRLYDAARSCVRTADDMRRVVLEAAQDDAAEGSRWLELQVDPTTYGAHLGGTVPALEVVLDAAREASATTPTAVAVVVAASRTRHPLDARALARLAARYAGEGPGTVVGFGLSNDERAGTTADFAAAFDIARRAGLACVPHSGELLGAGHVAHTLDALRPDRLGHGVRSAEDPAVLERVVAAGVALEVCPTSNVSLGVAHDLGSVPLRTLLDAGARVALGADDPLLFGPRLAAQYRSAREDHDLDDAGLAALARSSISASRAPEAVRRELLAAVDGWLAAPADG